MTREIKVGVAEDIITPDKLVQLNEYNWVGKARYKKDDLLAKALYFDDGREKALLIMCDLISFLKDLADELRLSIGRRLGLKPEQVMLVATQNHGAPLTIWNEGITRREGDLGRWYKQLEQRLIGTALRAKKDVEPVQFRFREGRVEGLGANRRPIGKSGKVIMTWHRPRAKDIADWGVQDHSVKVITMTNAQNRLKAVLFHYTCHPNVLWATEIYSADFPGRAAQLVKAAYGPDVVAVFLNGFCGDIDPTRNMRVPPEAYNAPAVFRPENKGKADLCIPESDRFGNMLGGELIKLIAQTDEKGQTLNRLQIAAGHVRLALANPKAVIKKAVFDRKQGLEIQVLTLGREIALVGVPAEPFLTLEQQIEKVSPYPWTMPLGHTNGYFGYISDRDAPARGGFGAQGIFRPGSGEKVVHAALKQLKKLARK